ncbi:Cytoplasmic aconitate hydratase [Pseudolycoriella hygida]|uniref:aconitate hydratase n=1 Tax=Pseudolycoriella hygida TaxID=35572 RepID=A0A9Q0N2A6_9DIPT|nr:Cytoplasmic aconitate hydratase [Pseudolycoriella hygida]
MGLRASTNNPFKFLEKKLTVDGETFHYYDISHFKNISKLPFSIRVLLESAVRNCDGNFETKKSDVITILNWETYKGSDSKGEREYEIPFKPARVILQDANGVPAVVDFSAMRDAVSKLGGDPKRINPICPSHLIIDHTIQVDYFGTENSLAKNERLEIERNRERFAFLKWGANVFENMKIFPPGSGIMHQINMEFLASIVFVKERDDGTKILYPDSVVGNDSHTTMINSLGVLGWGVGGIEAESVMLGQTISFLLPEVIGYKLIGMLDPLVTTTDLILTITENLRNIGVVGKFVEFFGPGVKFLTIEERATISIMAPEFGATVGFFAIDENAISYLRQTNRSEKFIAIVRNYLKKTKQFRNYSDPSEDPTYSKVVVLDLSTVVRSVSGPKRPQDRINLSDMKSDFSLCLSNNVGFRGFGLPKEQIDVTGSFMWDDGKMYSLKHGSVVIAAIASATNTSNPTVMFGAGILANNAVKKGLKVAPYIKTSLSPGSYPKQCFLCTVFIDFFQLGSKVVTRYLQESGLLASLEKLRFNVTGYGCMTCIGKSGLLDERVAEIIEKNGLVCCGVISGNRNFEGRIHPLTRANYLASPLLVVAYALAGTIDIDFETDPIGIHDDRKIYLKDIWPSRDEIQALQSRFIAPRIYKEIYDEIEFGSTNWQLLNAADGKLFSWDAKSTFIKRPPFFENMSLDVAEIEQIRNARVLLNLGDSITTDHISPGGLINENSPAARYLAQLGVIPGELGSYSSRRGNDAVMARGTFANNRIINKFMLQPGPKTIHFPSLDEMDIFDCAERYRSENVPLILLVGKEYGCGSSRDWAAKGLLMQGVKAVIAESYERIHRSNLVGMGIVPLEYLAGENAETLGLTGNEMYNILLPKKICANDRVDVVTNCGIRFQTKVRFDTDLDVEYYKNGGILHYTIRKMMRT